MSGARGIEPLHPWQIAQDISLEKTSDHLAGKFRWHVESLFVQVRTSLVCFGPVKPRMSVVEETAKSWENYSWTLAEFLTVIAVSYTCPYIRSLREVRSNFPRDPETKNVSRPRNLQTFQCGWLRERYRVCLFCEKRVLGTDSHQKRPQSSPACVTFSLFIELT